MNKVDKHPALFKKSFTLLELIIYNTYYIHIVIYSAYLYIYMCSDSYNINLMISFFYNDFFFF